MSFTESIEEIVAENPNGLLGCPRGWSRSRMSEFAILLNGFAFSSSQFHRDRGVPLIRIRDLGRSTTETRFNGTFDSRYVVRAGDLLVGMDGDFKCAIWQGEPALLNQRVCRIEPDETRYSRRFLFYCLPGYLDAIHGRTSSLTVKHLSSKTLLDLPLPVPPRAEQDAIAESLDSYFSRLDEVEAGLERVQRNLKRYRASVLQAAVTGRLVPTEAQLARAEGREYEPASELLKRILVARRRRWEESGRRGRYEEPAPPDTANLPELPEGWWWATVEQVAEVKGGITKNSARRSREPLREVPYLRVANVQRGHLDLAEVTTIPATESEIEELRLEAGDVLFNEGGDRDKLGRGWIWSGEIPECIHQNHVFRARLLTDDIVPQYLSWYGNTAGQRYFFEEGKQTTNLASINMRKLRGLPVAVPPLNEQRRIGGEVDRLASVAAEEEAEVLASLQRLRRLRQSILRSAFEGRLVPSALAVSAAGSPVEAAR